MSTLVTGEAVELSVQPAALAARALSCAIDWLLYTLVNIGLLIGMFWLLLRILEVNTLILGSVMTIMSISVFVLLPMLVEVLTKGRSVGKLILGLRIVRDDGGAIRVRHAVIRALLWPFEVLATGGGLAALSGLVSPQTKRLGDYLAGTLAVSERTSPPPPVTTHVAPQLAHWLSETDVSAVPTGLHRRIVAFLAIAPNLGHESRWQRAVELATELNPHVAPAPPEGTLPEQFLSAIAHRQRLTEAAKQQRRGVQAQQFRAGIDHLPHGLRLRSGTAQGDHRG
ncbi:MULTISPECIES: RDD family protein [Brevibacterium]|uniref:RDD family protein n=1 Tax=Brevibacterium casei TaxID=33889 RepID=A0A7T3ZWZ2_9MICO|nr:MULTISPECIES: RDD family protein [Brevibacterium]QQB13164.1 RDD family protein [Brevibacterium casei]